MLRQRAVEGVVSSLRAPYSTNYRRIGSRVCPVRPLRRRTSRCFPRRQGRHPRNKSRRYSALTYYTVGLIGYLARVGKTFGIALDPDMVMAFSVPLVALLAALAVRHIRRAVARDVRR